VDRPGQIADQAQDEPDPLVATGDPIFFQRSTERKERQPNLHDNQESNQPQNWNRDSQAIGELRHALRGLQRA
jgi:hypothetical protein